jgi:hypothetical protein
VGAGACMCAYLCVCTGDRCLLFRHPLSVPPWSLGAQLLRRFGRS